MSHRLIDGLFGSLLAVLASFPLCDVTEDDLTQNPQFCKLLVILAKHMDRTGLTASLKAELEKAEQNLQSQRRQWLHTEVLHRSLQEMIQDRHVRKTEPPDQSMLHETMEKCLLVAECVRQLDPSDTTNQEPPFVLGLTPQNVKELMPADKDVQRMRQALPKHLEKHLREKCLTLLSYYHESEGLKTVKMSHLSGLLDKEKTRAESLRGTCQENRLLLQRQTQLYISELIKCIQLLQTLILDHRLKIQTDLDGKKLDYLEGKCQLVLQKLNSAGHVHTRLNFCSQKNKARIFFSFQFLINTKNILTHGGSLLKTHFVCLQREAGV
uniref:HAUS augmin-like complex, subunit 4 n=1 Tax=Oryzias melastigma TaxID=30732 RepID=A0A3B3D5D0_ORYME